MTAGRSRPSPGGRPSARRSLAVAAFTSVLLAIVAAGGGCEIAIGDTVPAFACVQGRADVCPAGQVCSAQNRCVTSCPKASCSSGNMCNPFTGLCEPIGDGGMNDEVTVNDGNGSDVVDGADTMPTEEDANPPMETGTDTTSNCPGGITCSCGGNSQCNSKLCVAELAVGTGLYQAAGSTNFCSTPCCTSADCPSTPVQTVCYATGQGGNYCVNPAWIGRAVPAGNATGGAACGRNADCRSGLCAGNSCADTCCSTGQSSTECAGGTLCTFGNFPGTATIDKNYSAYCGSGGSSPGGSTCLGNSDCQSYLCATAGGSSMHCWNACRSSSDCTGNYYCNYVIPTMTTPAPIVGACFPTQGSLAMGQTCDPANDMCKGFCDPVTKMCTDVCFGNADCAAMSGWYCRDETIPVNGGGSYSVLCCGT